MASKTFACALFLCLLQLHSSAGQTLVKGVYWSPDSGFPVSSIDSTLFTHILCAFADLNSTTYQVTISSDNSAQFSTFTQTVQLKNPSVKTLLSVGGGGSRPPTFASMASQASTRKSFIDSSIQLARNYKFHGLDLDWEYPNTTTKMNNLGLLLNEWRAAVTKEASSTGNATLLLTAAFYYTSNYHKLNYPFQAISNSLDWVNVMAYDIYGPWERIMTRPPAPLYNPTSQVSGDAGIKAWIQAGVPAKKLALGLPFYGYAWRLLNASKTGIFAPANGSAISSDGSQTYSQITDLITQSGYTKVYNSSFVTNYCYKGLTWIGYDDTESIFAKVMYAKAKGLLGYFAWNVGADINFTLAKNASITWGP